MFQSANKFATGQLVRHKNYAAAAGLSRLGATVEALHKRAEEIAARPDMCMLSIGWGGGAQSKIAFVDTDNPAFRNVLRQFPIYQMVVQSGLPFPKTRRVIFQGGEPSSLPGWVMVQVE